MHASSYILVLRRKIYDRLVDWKENGTRPLIVKGQRKVGKTFIVDRFARDHYSTYIYADLSRDEGLRSIFESADLTVDSIVRGIQVISGIGISDPDSTLIFLDEVQECPRALSALKAFAIDGRYRVVASGSLSGMTGLLPHGGGSGFAPLSPIGYVESLTLHSLDFEEFLWANSIPEDAIAILRECIRSRTPLDPPLFYRFSELFRIFQIVGGMPASVSAYLEDSRTFASSSKELALILSECRLDVTRYASREDSSKTSECFNSIPSQLMQTSKRFHYSRIRENGPDSRKGRLAADVYMDSLLRIKNAGYGNFCYGLRQISSPLMGQIRRDVFKVYLSDTGMLVHMFGEKAIAAVYTSDTAYNTGAVAENSVAECLMKCGYQPTYYLNNNGKGRMEIDFVLEFFGGLVAIEVKSGKDRAAPSIGKVANHFDIWLRVMFENGNISEAEDGILHLPLFASAFVDVLDERPSFLRRRPHSILIDGPVQSVR